MFHRAGFVLLSRILTTVDEPVLVLATPLSALNPIVCLALAMQPNLNFEQFSNS